MCEALRIQRVLEFPAQSVREYLALANELHQAGSIELAGTSVEIINDLPTHPMYSPMVVQLNELAAEASLLDYMAAPHRIAPALAKAVARPVVYNSDMEGNTAVHVPDHWRPDLDRQTRDEEVEMLVLLMSVSARLLKSL